MGYVRNDDYRKLVAKLCDKIPQKQPKVPYNVTAKDYDMAFRMFSYLAFCRKEQMEVAAFYNNLFRTADSRTILQATVNNIQMGTKEPATMKALQQIYKTLATEMELVLPSILQGFTDNIKKNRSDPHDGMHFINDGRTKMPKKSPLKGKQILSN